MLDDEARGRARSLMFRSPVLKVPSPHYRGQVRKPGSSSAVWLSADSSTVLKAPFAFYIDGCDEKTSRQCREQERESAKLIEREKTIYRHLGDLPTILHCLEISEMGILFPYKKNGNLREFLGNKEIDKPCKLKRDWVRTALTTLDFIHAKGVLQVDISARNFLVNDDQSIVLCDFSGSIIGDEQNLVRPETRYGRPNAKISIITEIFAIGSLIYEIIAEKPPYAEHDDDVVDELFSSETYPLTKNICFGEIIGACWTGRFQNVRDIMDAFAPGFGKLAGNRSQIFD